MKELIYDGSLEAQELRHSFTRVMSELMEQDSRIVLGDADVGFSIYGESYREFRQRFGDRFFDVGIAEADLVGIGAGMSLVGKIPYLAIFAPFLTRRAYDAISVSLAYAELGAKLIGTDPGYTSAYNGGSHSALEDVGIMRCIPNINIIDVTDSVMLEWALRDLSAPEKLYYIRTPRGMKVKKVYAPGTGFELGKAKLLRQGSDLTLTASGLMVSAALEAADKLEALGLSARVLDIVSVKPIDADALISSAEETGAMVVCDNHRAIGGLCSAVAEVIACSGTGCPIVNVAVGERFGEVGPAEYLIRAYGLSAEDIVQAALKVVERKRK